ncbi:glycosyltransferase family 4 protein [Carboxylicivirga taeanensis]|uniref:glycosyltransferase family 4 protein n=1 Tax=Carboxylicivirga taeanensis TaxID=1416875 RepID=UPI003F6E0B5F
MQNNKLNTICFVIPYYVTFGTGGAEIQVYYLINEFLNRGWNVEVLTGGRGFEETVRQSPYYDGRIRFLNYRLRTIRSLEFFDVLRLLFKCKAHVFYQRTDFALSGACAWYCKIRGRKMMYALAQDKDAFRSKYQTALKAFKYQSKIKRSIRHFDFYCIDKLVEYAKQNAAAIICQSRQQQEFIRSNFTRDSYLIPSSFPVNTTNGQQKKENIVLWVGNMSKIKQPELFLKLVDYLAHTAGWRFVMIGRVSEDYKSLSHPKIDILGECSYDETNRWFERAKIFVNTSESEGMPNTFIQSWLNHVLVLSLNVNPNGVFDAQHMGLCFHGDLQQMAASLDDYLQEKSRSDILERASSYALETFDVRRNVDQLIELINK